MIVIATLVRYKLILFGLPYSLHPDETYIYKDPLKILLLYKDHNFSQSYNLVDWLFAVWTGIVFLFGKLFNQWDSFDTFRDLLVLEDGKIILAYRILSLLASVGALSVLYDLCRKMTASPTLRTLFILTFLFNPIELLSDNWIKYDPYVFLMLSILLNYSYSCFFLLKRNKLKTLYILSILAVAVRIEFIVFFISILIVGLFSAYRELPPTDRKDTIKKQLKHVLIGVVLYLLATLKPLTYLYANFSSASGNMGVAKSFEQVIFTRLMEYIRSGAFIDNIANNFVFYFNVCLLSLGPLVIIYLLLVLLRDNRTRYLFLFIFLIGLMILLYGANGTHYFLSLSVVFIFGSCLFITRLKNPRLQLISAIFNLLYMASLSSSFLYTIFTQDDPRLSSLSYIKQNIPSNNLLAIETHSMNGLGPPINECRDVLLKKSEIVAIFGSGTGETYRMRANFSNNDCREILDVFSTDYFAGSNGANLWINTYDSVRFKERAPDYFITTRSVSTAGPDGEMLPPAPNAVGFYKYIVKNYVLDKAFKCRIADPRLSYLLDGGLYFRPIHIYKKLNVPINY